MYTARKTNKNKMSRHNGRKSEGRHATIKVGNRAIDDYKDHSKIIQRPKE